MTVKLSAEREAEILADYRQRQKAKDEANAMLDKMRADQKAKQEAFWAKMNKPHIVKVEKTHKCAGCNATISKGSQAVLKSKIENVSGSGWTGAFISSYYCLVCCGEIKRVEL